MHYNYNILLSLYFVVPLFYIILTIIFVAKKPISVLQWLLIKSTNKTTIEVQAIDKNKLDGLYKYLRNCLILISVITLSFAIVFCGPGVPENMSDFFISNILFVLIGVMCLSTSFSKAANVGTKIFGDDKTGEKKETYISEGMLFGMIIGSALGAILFNSAAIGSSVFMSLGMIVGSMIPKIKRSE